MQTGTGAPNLTGHQRQRNQTPAVIGAMDMLRHSHTPENHPRLRTCECTRNIAQRLGLNPTDFRHFFRRKIFQVGLFGFPILGVGFDILLIIQPFFHNHVHNRVQHRHIGAGAELQHMTGKPLQRLAARIHHDQLATPLGELFEICCSHRMVFDRVGPDHNRYIGIFNLVKGCSYRCRADVLHKRRN